MTLRIPEKKDAPFPFRRNRRHGNGASGQVRNHTPPATSAHRRRKGPLLALPGTRRTLPLRPGGRPHRGPTLLTADRIRENHGKGRRKGRDMGLPGIRAGSPPVHIPGRRHTPLAPLGLLGSDGRRLGHLPAGDGKRNLMDRHRPRPVPPRPGKKCHDPPERHRRTRLGNMRGDTGHHILLHERERHIRHREGRQGPPLRHEAALQLHRIRG